MDIGQTDTDKTYSFFSGVAVRVCIITDECRVLLTLDCNGYYIKYEYVCIWFV